MHGEVSANIAVAFVGGMAGCAMIGQSAIDVTLGGRPRCPAAVHICRVIITVMNHRSLRLWLLPIYVCRQVAALAHTEGSLIMTATPPEIGRLESARADAIVAGNLEALAAMVTNDYIHVDADGRVRDKAGYLEAVRSAAGRYTDYRLRDNHITVLDNMAWVHGSFENRFQAADGTIRNKSARHLRLYRLEAGGWRNCFHQGTLITAPE